MNAFSRRHLAMTFDGDPTPTPRVVLGGSISVDLSPHVARVLRLELGSVTREFAQHQEPALRDTLLKIADAFEAH